MNRNIAEISAKLVKVIRTRDASRVRYITDVLEHQKNATLAVEVFAHTNTLLEKSDRDLQRWFQDIYFEDCSPEVRALWLDCINLTSDVSPIN